MGKSTKEILEKALQKKIIQLQEQINALTRELSSKEVIIDALVQKTLNEKRSFPLNDVMCKKAKISENFVSSKLNNSNTQNVSLKKKKKKIAIPNILQIKLKNKTKTDEIATKNMQNGKDSCNSVIKSEKNINGNSEIKKEDQIKLNNEVKSKNEIQSLKTFEKGISDSLYDRITTPEIYRQEKINNVSSDLLPGLCEKDYFEETANNLEERAFETSNSMRSTPSNLSNTMSFTSNNPETRKTEDPSKAESINFSKTNVSPNEGYPIENKADPSNLFISQIQALLQPKTKTTEFKLNFSFEMFIDYCGDSIEFSLTDKTILKIKNPLKIFITGNLEKIIKSLIERVNDLTLNQICSTLLLINSEIEYPHKLVIFHDFVLEIEDLSRLNFIASALFNNRELESDLLSQIIKKILYHQICIDYDVFKDEGNIINCLDLIRNNLVLLPPNVTLWDSLSHFMGNHEIFNGQLLRPEAIEQGFMLRMLCHYLDWDYTYNKFILTQLFPKIMAEKTPIHVYYLGVLMVNAIRQFKSHESIELIFRELKGVLEWVDGCSVVSYLILKQFFEVESEEWLVTNAKRIEEMGFSLEYLRAVLLL